MPASTSTAATPRMTLGMTRGRSRIILKASLRGSKNGQRGRSLLSGLKQLRQDCHQAVKGVCLSRKGVVQVSYRFKVETGGGGPESIGTAGIRVKFTNLTAFKLREAKLEKRRQNNKSRQSAPDPPQET